MFGTGVASFGHVNGVHIQNVDTWEKYIDMLSRDEIPLGRALQTTPRERLVREMLLQLKTGRLSAHYFWSKFGADIFAEFHSGYDKLRGLGLLTIDDTGVSLTAEGYLQIDRYLPTFFDADRVSNRYT